MTDSLEDNKDSVNIGGPIFINFLSVYDIVVNAKEEEADDIGSRMDNFTITRWRLGLTRQE